MDLKLSNYDIDLTNGELSFVDRLDAVRQDIEMALRTWLEETPYDRNAGVPYLQIIFVRGTTLEAIRFIISEIILGRDNVTDILELGTLLDRETRTLTITGSVRAFGEIVAFEAGAPLPPGPWVPPSNGLASWIDLERRRYVIETGVLSIVDEGSIAGTLGQAVTAQQPLIAQTLGLSNLQALAPDGVNDELDHSTAAALWQFLSDNSEATILCALKDPAQALGTLVSTCDGAATDTGLVINRVAGALAVIIGNGSGAFPLSLSTAVATGDKILAIRKDATGIETQINGVVVAGLTDVYAIAPADSAPDATLRLFNIPAGGQAATFGPGWWAAYDRRISDTELAEVFAQLNTRYRIFP